MDTTTFKVIKLKAMSEKEQFLANFEQEFRPLPRWTEGDIIEK